MKFMNTGEYLKKKREKAKLSQGQLAKILGFKSAQFISNMERNISFPPKEIIDLLCTTLKISKKELVSQIVNDIAKDYLK